MEDQQPAGGVLEAPQELCKIVSEKIRLAKIENAAQIQQSSTSIFRISSILKDQLFTGEDDKAYIPQIVSLGPYHSHSGLEHLLKMDCHKARAVSSVVGDSPDVLKFYLDSIYNLNVQARRCYEEKNNLNRESFTEMMLFDGCFMLEFIRGYHKEFIGYSANDTVFSKRGSNSLASSIIRDMIKVENQLPFIVLEKLSELKFGNGEEIAKSAAFMFIKWLTGEKLDDVRLSSLTSGNSNYLHCLHVFQRSLLIGISEEYQTSLKNNSDSSTNTFEGKNVRHLHNATDLIEYGIKFKRQLKEWRPFWDMKFKNGTLEMPRLFLNNGRVKTAFQNLIIFEQQSRECNNVHPIVTEYVVFMDKLMNSATDVGRLHEAGVIVHQLRSDADVVGLFNELAKAAFLESKAKSHYLDLYMKINSHCNRRHRWKSELQRKYFNNPWTIASLIGAIILLVLTFLQTYYTLYAYYWPRS